MARDANQRRAGRRNRTQRNLTQRAAAPRAAVVLVLVLVVVAMVALAGFSFAELMLTENKATHLHGDSLAQEQAIASGVELMRLFCEQPAQTRATAGAYNNPLLFRSIPLKPEDRNARNTTERKTCFSIVAPAADAAQAAPIRFGLENESGRLHLGDVLAWELKQPGAGRNALLRLPGMTEAIADAILDWIDSDSQPRPQGAEREHYAELPKSYQPRNALPETLEELLLVKGVTRQLLFGDDANYNHQVDDHELASASSRGGRSANQTVGPPWISLLTLYSGQRNLSAEGAPRIDLNGPDLSKLNQQLTGALGATWAGFVVAMRQYGPYAGPDPGTPDAVPMNASVSGRYVFASALDLVGARVAVPGSGSGQPAKVYVSPMANESPTGTELAALLDKTTVVAAPVIRGGVSVNHASRDVLRAVPGIDDGLADRIVAARGASQNGNASAGQDGGARQSPTWLLREGLVDLARMKVILPFICAEGDVFRGEVIGHFQPAGQSTRAEVVIDATVLPARQVAYRDLRFFGTVYPAELFDDESAALDPLRRPTQRPRPPASSRAAQ